MRVRTIEIKKVIFDSVEEVEKVWDLIEDSEEVESIKEDYTYMIIDDAKREIEILLEKMGFENPRVTSDLGYHQGSGASFTADYFYIDKDEKIDLDKLKEGFAPYQDIIDAFGSLYDEIKGYQTEAYCEANSFRNYYLHSKTLNWHIAEDCEFYIERDGHVGYEESMLESIEDEVERVLNRIYFDSMSDEEALKESVVENEIEFDLTEEMEKKLTNTKETK